MEVMVVLLVLLLAVTVLLLIKCVTAGRAGRALRAENQALKEELSETGKKDVSIQNDLRKKYDEIGWLRSMLTHNIRMPLSIIDGYGRLLLSDMVKDEQKKKECLKKICGNIGYLNRITALVLEGKSGAFSYDFQKMDLIACIREVCTYVENATRRAGVGIYMNTNLDFLEIEADYIQIMRIFYNLFENSFKYTIPQNSIVITIDKIGENQVLVIYKDNGKGMQKEETAHIFEPCYQGSNRKEGSGMGLSFVKEVIEAHGGSVSAQSDVGKGMGIYIYFPIKRNL